MPEVLIPGPAGKIEARYHPGALANSPVAVLLHAHPSFGGSMGVPLMYQLYWALAHRGFTIVRFNFRGVGKSQGIMGVEDGELDDAGVVLDWVLERHPACSSVMVCGFSYGAWVGMQLIARRPEISEFVVISPPTPIFDFTFLSTEYCQARGIVVNGSNDHVAPPEFVKAVVDRINGSLSTTEHVVVDGANHLFDGKIPDLMKVLGVYLDSRGKA